MNLNPYPKYKDSGIEWLGKVPEGWEVRKLGYHAEMTVPMRDKPPVFDGDIPWIRIEDFDGKYIYDSKSDQRVSKKIIRSMNLKVYPVGTVLCSCSCNMGATAIVSSPLISNQTFIGIVPRSDISSEFLYYLMNASSERLQYLGSGAIQQYLSKENFKNLKLALPPLQDQTAIANFLDQKTSKIDELIKKNEKLVKLLKEKRQAVISHAVTKGLDPDARMKDSGIEWIGEVPEGWEVIPLRRIGKIVNGSTPESSNEDYWDGDIAWLTPDDLGKNQDKYITDSKRKITYKGYINCGATIVPKDSLILSTRAPIGHLALSSLEVCFNQGCRGIIFQNNYNPSFYYYYFSTLKEVLNSYGQGTTFFELGANKLASINVVIPLLQDQTTIANYLDQKTAKIDEAVQTILSQIEKLKEYRQTLISNVVTGKVKIDEKI